MTPPGHTLASGVRSVAVAGDVTNSVIVTGDDVTIELRVDTDDALLANLLEGARVPRWTERPVPLTAFPAPPADHVGHRDQASTLTVGVSTGGRFVCDVSGPREIGKTFLVRHALGGASIMPGSKAYVFAKGKRHSDILQELHEAFFEARPPAIAGHQQVRSDLARTSALVVLDSVELERDEVRDLDSVLLGGPLVLVARERPRGEGPHIAVRGLELGDALALVEQELGRALEAGERPAVEELCTLLDGHPFELRQAAAAVRDGERSFAELEEALGRRSSADTSVLGSQAARDAAPAERAEATPPAARGELADERAAATRPAARGELARLLLGSLAVEDAAIVELLASLRGATVGAEHVAAIVGRDDVTQALHSLEARRLIASASPRFRIAGALRDGAAGGPDAVAGATAYFASWARRHRARPARLLSEAPALLELIGRAESQGRHADVIALGRASDAAFAHGRRWGTWSAVLDAVLSAAERSGDDGSRAWALHQLGTRAYCLGEVPAAVAMLQEALELRERIGERAAAEVTRYNLEFIASPPPAGDGGGGGGGGGGSGPATRIALVVALVAALAVAGAAVAVGLGGGEDPTPTSTVVPIVTDPVVVPPPPLPTTDPTVTTATQTQTTPPPAAPPPPVDPPPPPPPRPVDPPPIIPPPVDAPPIAPPVVDPPPPPPIIG